jgi:drug/metabolite transporter (DMT)-like permease
MSYMLLVLFGVICYGISAFGRKLTIAEMSPYQLQMIAGFIYIALIPLWIFITPHNKNLSINNVSLAVFTTILGIMGGLSFSFLLKGNANAGVVSALLGISPVITIALSYFVYHDVISIWKCLAFFFALLSVILVNY